MTETKFVLEITGLTMSFSGTAPSIEVCIEAEGKVTYSGWTNARLVPHAVPPDDGIYKFDFMADAPIDPAVQAMPAEPGVRLYTITASTTFDRPKGFMGVRVFAALNSFKQEV